LGRDNDFEYPQEAMDATIKEYMSYNHGRVLPDVKLSMPRGKNIGWPHPIGGMARELNDSLLILHAALVERFRKQGGTLRDATEYLAQRHGKPFTIYGERYQHTDKIMPLVTKQGTFSYSYNFEPRVRAIYMSPKFQVMWNRRVVKNLLSLFLNTPYHNQDRDVITKTIKQWEAKGWVIIALDVSKFDQSFGNKRGKQVLKGLASLATKLDPQLGSASTIEADLVHEWDNPLLCFFRDQAFLRHDVPILMSGVSTTTPTNCFGNRLSQNMGMKEAVGCTYDELAAGFMTLDRSGPDKWWGSLAWGDDGLIAIDPKIKGFADAKQALATLQKGYRSMKLTVDAEPATKYLGTVYGAGNFKKDISLGYSMGRFLQLQFFPERAKIYPFSVIGYVARLMTLPPNLQKEVHTRMRPFWSEEMGEYFLFEERVIRLKRAVKEAEKYGAKIQELDNVLQSLTNGASEFVDSFAGEVPTEVAALLGLTRIDLSDLDTTINKEVAVLAPKLRPLITDFRKGSDVAYSSILELLRIQYNLRFKVNDLLY
jgi:hypothetical protein